MLFNSQEFLLVFLPVVFAGFVFLSAQGWHRLAVAWVSVASLAFYAWWEVRYLPLLVGSIVFNFLVARRLAASRNPYELAAGIAVNVLLLGFFKYTTFVVANLVDATGLQWSIPHIVLPLAISFFTFQQIAYLVDAYDGVSVEHDFGNYALFISFFPQLIAGPIVHHREMLPQYSDPEKFRLQWGSVALGVTLFLFGLLKKVEIADRFALVASPVFAAAAQGEGVSLFDAWGGALAYSLQLYFDFSGYTDMALGLGLMFCIRLPQNFNSPFKAAGIIEFWTRWHMTLTRFLTAYVYNPISLRIARRRAARGRRLPRRGRMSPGAWFALVAFPTLVTMFISGVWHGAGWQFIVFGMLHGVYICINHAWRELRLRFGLGGTSPLRRAASVLLTFLCVVVSFVFFRAADVPAALNLLAGMVGVSGPEAAAQVAPGTLRGALAEWGIVVAPLSFVTREHLVWIALMLVATWILPNAQQWLGRFPTALQARPDPSLLQRLAPVLVWRPSIATGARVGIGAAYLVLRAVSNAPTEFLYFQF